MPLSALILPILAAAAQPAEPPVMVVGYAWAPFISPMGEPFRPRPAGDDTLGRWFSQADRNRDSALTPDEMLSDADRFFALLDGNGDGSIDPDELVAYEWEIAPEIQMNSRWRRSRGQPATPQSDKKPRRQRYEMAGLDDCLQGAARYSLLNMPQPVAAADADFNRAITRDEFRQAAVSRFQLLDRSGGGRLTLQQLQPFVPALPKSKCRRDRKASDTRVGLPLPPGD